MSDDESETSADGQEEEEEEEITDLSNRYGIERLTITTGSTVWDLDNAFNLLNYDVWCQS